MYRKIRSIIRIKTRFAREKLRFHRKIRVSHLWIRLRDQKFECQPRTFD